MKNGFKFMLFLFYTSSIFFISNYYILAGITVFNVLLLFIYKVPKLNSLYNLYSLSLFILLVVAFNSFFMTIYSAILIGIKLLLVCNITYTFKYILTPIELANAIEFILAPIKLFKLNPKEVSLTINIAITFVPILLHELIQIRYSLKAKGININTIIGFKYSLQALLPSLFKKTIQLEYSLKAKGCYFEK